MKTGERTRERIMQTGCQIWQINPHGVTCRAIARKLGINHATILYHYSTVKDLKLALASYAVRNGHAEVIAQLIAVNHSSVQSMPPVDKQRYLKQLA